MVQNVRWLWAIVAVMGIAMIATVYIHLGLIRENADWVNQKFDKEVFAGIYNTIKIIEQRDQLNERQLRELLNALSDDNATPNPLTDVTRKPNARVPGVSFSLPSVSHKEHITEHIDLGVLDFQLRENFRKRGIDLDYHYGVYDYSTSSFVIMDGIYSVPRSGDLEASVSGVSHDLLASKYSVSMFSQSRGGMGKLYVTFPTRRDNAIRATYQSMAVSLFFVALILMCFGYTVYIILRQKSLSLMKTDFINNMTHEFKTPIATISLAADSMSSDKVKHDTAKLDRYIGIIKQENARMLSQVEAVLHMAKFNSSNLDLDLELFDLNSVVSRAAENISLQVDKKNGVLQVAPSDSPLIIMADPNHISNVLHNLLDNANKYSPTEPAIRIVVSQEREWARIDVEDEGIGMSRDQVQHIFEKFYRVPTGNVHDVKGFGLGLAYVKEIINAHKGKIKVKSSLGLGTRVSIFLPIGAVPK